MEVEQRPEEEVQPMEEEQPIITTAPADDETELYFLIAHTLSSGPLTHVGETLAREAAARGLLPARIDYTGQRHPVPYDRLQDRYGHLPPDALLRAVNDLVAYRRTELQRDSNRNVSSVLDPAVIPGREALRALPGFDIKPPLWSLPPYSTRNKGNGLPAPHLALLRETGLKRGSSGVGPLSTSPSRFSQLLHHHLTVRGHSSVAYCIAFDRTNCHAITGSDDRLVKVWSIATGLLKCTCHGHEGEVSDLSVNCDNTMFASASVDGVIRVWRLHGEGQLGYPIAVLKGHNEMVTAIDFSPTAPHVLISTSFDGTLRVWDARDGSIPPLVRRWEGTPVTRLGTLAMPGSSMVISLVPGGGARSTRFSERRQLATATQLSRGAAAASWQAQDGPAAGRRGGAIDHHQGSDEDTDGEENEEENAGEARRKLLTCHFSPDGRYIVAGSSDFCVYVWRWSTLPSMEQEEEGKEEKKKEIVAGDGDAKENSEATSGAAATAAERDEAGPSTSAAAVPAAPRAAAAATPPAPTSIWPSLEEHAKLEGHRNDVWLLQHSNSGEMLASGSVDGTVRVWRKPKRFKRRGIHAWHLEANFTCPVDEEAAALARRRGRQMPPPRVDQITWTCDDKYIICTMQDLKVHVFSIADNKLVHSLKGHVEPSHVLLAHPFDPAIAVTASYSGEAIVWDVIQGKSLKVLESKTTRPGSRDWPEGLPFVDGQMAADGNSFALTDAAGQLHIYGLGPRSSLTARAPYDQFLSTDYEPLIQDLNGNVAFASNQEPAHIRSGREVLGDATGAPYPLPFQEAYRAGNVLEVSAADAQCEEEGKQPGYILAAPTLTAAAWKAYTSGGSDTSAQNAVARASQRLAEYEAVLDSREAAERARRRSGTAAAVQLAAARPATTGGAARGAAAAAATAATNVVYISDDEQEAEPSSDEDQDEDYDAEEEEEGGGASRRRRQQRDGLRHSSRLASRRPEPQEDRFRFSDDNNIVFRAQNDPNIREQQRRDREDRHRRRQEAHMAALEQQRRRQQRNQRGGSTRGTSSRAATAADHEEDFYSSEEDELEDLEGEEYSAEEEVSLDSEEDYDDSEAEDGAGPSSRRKRRSQRSRRESDRERASKRRRTATDAAPRRPRPSSAATPRPANTYAWLTGAEYRPAVYVPQAGDDVVYLREGHAAALAATSDNRRPPWEIVHRGRTMRPAEPCRIISLIYTITQDGTDATGVQATLELSDPASPLQGQTFTVDILPPSSGQAEFIVLRSRFEEAVGINWGLGDQCVSYWQTGATAGIDGAGGEWWRGTIVKDNRDGGGGGAGVVNDPYGCGGLWERYEIEWEGPVDANGELIKRVQSAAAPAGEDEAGPSTAVAPLEQPIPASVPLDEAGNPIIPDPADNPEDFANSNHSPWEIFKWEAVKNSPTPPGTSQLDQNTTERVAAAVSIAASKLNWEIFHTAPDWDESYVSLNGRTEYYNRRVPLPLALMDIAGRLHMRYYRQKEALQHDIRTVSDNASVFNGNSSAIAADARALARYLLAVVEAAAEDPPGEVDVEQYLQESEAGWAATQEDAADIDHHHGAEAIVAGGDEEAYGGEQEQAEEQHQPYHHHQQQQNIVNVGVDGYVFDLNEGELVRRSSRRRIATAGSHGDSGAPSPSRSGAGIGGGRYSLRVPNRVSYRDMLNDGLEDDDEGHGGGGGRGASRREPTPPQHHYSTRRAQAHEIAAIDAAAAAAAGGIDAGAAVDGQVHQQQGSEAQRQRMTIRLRRT